jgi:hypothetical protein
MIASSFKGRLRLRDPTLLGPSPRLTELRAVPGVSMVDHNPGTGSLLILYDPGLTDPSAVAAALGELGPEASEALLRSCAPPDERGLQKEDRALDGAVSVLAGLLSVVASCLLHQKKFHVMAGMFILEMIGERLWHFRHRRKAGSDRAALLDEGDALDRIRALADDRDAVIVLIPRDKRGQALVIEEPARIGAKGEDGDDLLPKH